MRFYPFTLLPYAERNGSGRVELPLPGRLRAVTEKPVVMSTASRPDPLGTGDGIPDQFNRL